MYCKLLRRLYRIHGNSVECSVSAHAQQQGEIVIKAILTDSHFWIPLIVLLGGIGLLLLLH
jgi:hypothetical protein